MPFARYEDLLASVRNDKDFHSIKQLVQPDEWEVKEIARVLNQADNFVDASQEFVHSFTTYRKEIGDFWTMPAELLQARRGDCDDKAILLTSILRNYIPAEKVFAAFGFWHHKGKTDGHMWVVMDGEGADDRIIEATASPDVPLQGHYTLQAMFNDKYAFSYLDGIKEFNLLPVSLNQATA